MREGRVLPAAEIVAIFKRFPEGNPYYIPLFLAYAYGMEKDEAFAITIDDVTKYDDRIKTTKKIKYNRSNNRHYISLASYAFGIYINVDPEVNKIIRRAVNYRINPKHTDVHFRDSRTGRIGTKGGEPLFFLNVREDGSFISPQGINHVARVIHGKKGKFKYVDPEWKFEDMITSGYYYRHRIFA